MKERLLSFWHKYKKKWYFWVIVIIILFLGFCSSVSEDEPKTLSENTTTVQETTISATTTQTETTLSTTKQSTTTTITTAEKETTTKAPVTIKSTTTTTTQPMDMITVWTTPKGKKYHIDKDCPGENAKSSRVSQSSIKSEDWCNTCSKEMK